MADFIASDRDFERRNIFFRIFSVELDCIAPVRVGDRVPKEMSGWYSCGCEPDVTCGNMGRDDNAMHNMGQGQRDLIIWIELLHYE